MRHKCAERRPASESFTNIHIRRMKPFSGRRRRRRHRHRPLLSKWPHRVAYDVHTHTRRQRHVARGGGHEPFCVRVSVCNAHNHAYYISHTEAQNRGCVLLYANAKSTATVHKCIQHGWVHNVHATRRLGHNFKVHCVFGHAARARAHTVRHFSRSRRVCVCVQAHA